jgi:hypothetical protein
MKFLTNALLLSAIPLVLTGCLTSDKDGAMDDSGDEADADADADSDSDADADSDSDADTAIWEVTVAGAATINSTANTWAGTETWDFEDVTNGDFLCTWSTETNSDSPYNSCAACTFAFEVIYANAVGTAGNCSSIGLPDIPGTITVDEAGTPLSRGYGFAPTYEVQGKSFANILMYYYTSDTGETSWSGIGAENGAAYIDNGDGTGAFSFEFGYSFPYYGY